MQLSSVSTSPSIRPKALSYLLLLVLVGCSTITPNTRPVYSDVDWDVIARLPGEPVSYRDTVQPILDQRCAVCHGCYDAPCQLKLTSFAGASRGANPLPVYDGTRILAAEPTRLGIDATTTEAWREKGFHAVLPNPVTAAAVNPEDNLRDSAMYQMLRLKQLHPQPKVGLLPAAITLGLDREQTCTTNADFNTFSEKNPLWGMPYGLPNLADEQYQTLVTWLAQGAPPPPPAQPSADALPAIADWEVLLNGRSKKEQLISRYLYEHLFIGHLHLAGTSDREFYRLVRSSTPPGTPVAEIATRRPFDNPGVNPFWYRLKLYDASIVAKSHVPYELSPERMQRYRELFFEPDYPVTELPSYSVEVASNAAISFAAIPAQSRYRFLLDDSRFFILGFIKGPVCRGQIAVNVIEDQFWVVFADPEADLPGNDPAFLGKVADYLKMPEKDENFDLTAAYTKYHKAQQAYLQARMKSLQTDQPQPLQQAVKLIWDGDGTNPNAALTIFRNFDSAAVEFGLVGDYPETAWIITYPQLERIHYLLVAGFDVFGNVGLQLNTRLFMDYLRMEGEDHFLMMLPPNVRQQERAAWYVGIRESRKKYFEEPLSWMREELVTGYTSNHEKIELFQAIEAHLGPMAGPKDYLNRCSEHCVAPDSNAQERATDAALRQIAAIKGAQLEVFPDVTFVRVGRTEGPDLPYTFIYNKGYSNITSFLENELDHYRDPSQDTLTVVKGFSGAYPNFFFSVPVTDVDDFAQRVKQTTTVEEYGELVALYGVRRTSERFWPLADWFYARYRQDEPLRSGIFDLNRYANL